MYVTFKFGSFYEHFFNCKNPAWMDVVQQDDIRYVS